MLHALNYWQTPYIFSAFCDFGALPQTVQVQCVSVTSSRVVMQLAVSSSAAEQQVASKRHCTARRSLHKLPQCSLIIIIREETVQSANCLQISCNRLLMQLMLYVTRTRARRKNLCPCPLTHNIKQQCSEGNVHLGP